jgi:uncharacterized protein
MTGALGRLLAGAAALIFAFGVLAQAPEGAVPVPKLVTRVTDQTGTLTTADRERLEEKLRAFEAAKGSQVAVLLVPTIGSEVIEEFAGRVADAWQLGRKGVDDGVLFVVAMQERKMRIHTGRGVQGTLTDAASKRIVAELVAPRFRAGDFAGGIDAGVDAILRAIEGEALPEPARKGSASPRVDTVSSYGNFLFLGFFLVPIVAMVLRSMFGRLLGAGATSGLTGVAAWLLFGSIAFGIVAALFAFILTLFSGAGFARSARRGGWGGYVPGGGWGGGGSWGGGGGGFSGGGGGFDGGGASGGW